MPPSAVLCCLTQPCLSRQDDSTGPVSCCRCRCRVDTSHPAVVMQGQRSAQRKVKAASAIGPQRRKDRILRALALKPPVGSPYADQMCLAGAELLVVQVKPATPPPQPAPPPVSIPALPPMIPQSWSLAQLSKMSQSMAPEALTQQFAGIAGLRFQPGVFPQLLQQPIAPQPHAPGGHSLMHQ